MYNSISFFSSSLIEHRQIALNLHVPFIPGFLFLYLKCQKGRKWIMLCVRNICISYKKGAGEKLCEIFFVKVLPEFLQELRWWIQDCQIHQCGCETFYRAQQKKMIAGRTGDESQKQFIWYFLSQSLLKAKCHCFSRVWSGTDFRGCSLFGRGNREITIGYLEDIHTTPFCHQCSKRAFLFPQNRWVAGNENWGVGAARFSLAKASFKLLGEGVKLPKDEH